MRTNQHGRRYILAEVLVSEGADHKTGDTLDEALTLKEAKKRAKEFDCECEILQYNETGYIGVYKKEDGEWERYQY